MIRERIAVVPEERAQPMYRLWHCFDCGLEFSMMTLELPRICPRCVKPFDTLIMPEQILYVVTSNHDIPDDRMETIRKEIKELQPL
jgi:hypothetical protein